MIHTCTVCSAETLNKPSLHALLIIFSVLVSGLLLCPKLVAKLYNHIEWDKVRVAYINFSILTSIPDALNVQFPEPV